MVEEIDGADQDQVVLVGTPRCGALHEEQGNQGRVGRTWRHVGGEHQGRRLYLLVYGVAFIMCVGQMEVTRNRQAFDEILRTQPAHAIRFVAIVGQRHGQLRRGHRRIVLASGTVHGEQRCNPVDHAITARPRRSASHLLGHWRIDAYC